MRLIFKFYASKVKKVASGRFFTFIKGGSRIKKEEKIRINKFIRSPEVRLVGEDGQQVGIIKLEEAIGLAEDKGLDLVEVAPNSNPPVCRIMDYGKYKYIQAQKAKKARKKQTTIVIKEMKMRPKIDVHDYEIKKKHIIRFLEKKCKVKVTIMFRGREMTHTELGRELLDRLANDLNELAEVESNPILDGRNMVMVLSPLRKK